MSIIIDDRETFDQIINTKDILILLYFTATWCGPCRAIKPFVNKIASHEEIKDYMKVLQIDVDECDDITEEYKVQCMPTFQFYRNKEKLDELSGSDEKKLSIYIAKYIIDRDTNKIEE